MIDEHSSLRDVCFIVCTELAANGTTVVLTGGSAATIYVPNRYQSHDADFVIAFGGNASDGGILSALGYREMGGVYRHPSSVYTLDFPPGPLSVGDEILSRYDTLRYGKKHLNILTRTDCVRDRLCAYFFWNDLGSLATAVDVALAATIDLDIFQAWSAREGMSDRYKIFLERLTATARDNHSR